MSQLAINRMHHAIPDALRKGNRNIPIRLVGLPGGGALRLLSIDKQTISHLIRMLHSANPINLASLRPFVGHSCRKAPAAALVN